MSGIAALVNARNVIQTFYNTQNKNLALQLFASTPGAGGNEIAYISETNDHAGHILNPSHLAAAKFQDMQFVIGVTEPTQSKENENSICIVSPVYRSLAPVEQDNKSVTFCSDNEEGFVFFTMGTDDNSTRMKAYKLHTMSFGVDPPMRNLCTGSALASYMAKKKAYVVYQDYQGYLREYQPPANFPDLAVVYDPAPGTPLAVVYVESKNAAFLYYRNQYGHICRIIKRDDQWSKNSCEKFQDVVPVKDCQMAVVHASDINHVFYFTNDSNGVQKFEDNQLD